MTSVNFEEIFQLIKDDITKENTRMRETTLYRVSTGELYTRIIFLSIILSTNLRTFQHLFLFALPSSPLFLL